MCQFIESIKLLDGKVYNLSWHQKRVEETFAKFFNSSPHFDLINIISSISSPNIGKHKIRILYDENRVRIEVTPYLKREIKSIEFIESSFNYPYKFENRKYINHFVEKAKADEVIFCKNGFLTDSSYANIALFDGNKWVTPKTFLLNGTTRQRLLYEGKLIEKTIKITDITEYQTISFINALNDLGEFTLLLNK